MIAAGGPPKSQQRAAPVTTQTSKSKSGSAAAAAAAAAASLKDAVGPIGSGDPKDYTPFKLSGASVSSGTTAVPTSSATAVPAASGRPESKDFSPFNFSWGAGVGQAASGVPPSGNSHQPMEEIWGNEAHATQPQSSWGGMSKAPGYRASNSSRRRPPSPPAPWPHPTPTKSMLAISSTARETKSAVTPRQGRPSVRREASRRLTSTRSARLPRPPRPRRPSRQCR